MLNIRITPSLTCGLLTLAELSQLTELTELTELTQLFEKMSENSFVKRINS